MALVYGQTLFYGFVYDDHETIEGNPWIRSVYNLPDFFLNKETTAPGTHLKEEIWRPIKTLSVALDYGIYKDNPQGFHLTNLLLHFFCVLLLYLNLRRKKMEGFWLLFIPSLFAVHPALVQNVSYISSRGDLLAGCFLALSLLMFESEKTVLNRFLSPFLYFTACLSKENAVMLPFFLVVYSWFFKIPIRRTAPFWGVLVLYFIYRFAMLGTFEQGGYPAASFWLTQASMIKVWAAYSLGIFWPFFTGVIPVTGMADSFFNQTVLFYAGLNLIWLVLCFRFAFSRQLWGLVLLWFFVFLLPVSNILPLKALMSWRFCYLSWMGYCLLPWLLFKNKNIPFLHFFLTAWLLVLAGQSFRFSSQFKNDLTLWMPVMEKHPELPKPYRVIANYYQRQSLDDKALSFLDLGLQRTHGDVFIRLDKASLLISKDQWKEAWEILDKFNEKEKGLGREEWLKLYAFTAFKLEYFDVLSCIENGKDRSLPSQVLLLKAHALTLRKENEKARMLYRELLKREISPSMRQDCIALLQMLQSGKTENP